MPPLYTRHAVLVVKLALLLILVLGSGGVVLARWISTPRHVVGEPVAQPIPFSHKHHVGDDGIDCRYCHTSVEKSGFANLPSTSICLSCHAVLFRDAPVLKPLHDSAASGRAIAWVRVHDLPDFAYFEHDAHVNKGVPCFACHGQVDQMPLTRRVASLQMQWCLQCHRDAPHQVRPLNEVVSMGPFKPLSSQELSQLQLMLHLRRQGGLTSCSTCHR